MIAGIDFSTYAIDLVLLDPDELEPPRWLHYPLIGADAWERTRNVRQAMPAAAGVLWDDITLVGIEEPAGHASGRLFRVQGAVLACIKPALEVHRLMPSQWRKAVGLPGNCHKWRVQKWVHGQAGESYAWSQDGCDAYCIARAVQLERVAA